MKELLNLYWAFFKIGGLTYGGGLTMLPMLKREVVDRYGWITEEEMLDYYAIGQCTPGIIAVNTATYVGYKQKGILGGIFATLGIISPSIIIITLVALVLEQFMTNKVFLNAMSGIRAVVCALMANTVITLAKKSLVSSFCIAVAVIVFVLSLITDIPTVLLVIIAGVAGVINDKACKGKTKEQVK